MPPPDAPDPASIAPPATGAGPDLAREALDQARAAAKVSRAAPARAPTRRRQAPPRSRPSGEPLPFGAALRGLVDERGWSATAAAASVTARWPELVGAEIAEHCHPAGLAEGVLTLEAESTAWATQLRLLGRSILARLAAEVGAGVVTRVVVRGPTGGPPRTGRLRVPGSRGPGDTYG